MLWTCSCYLQRLKNDIKQLNTVVFAMIWYLQRLKYEAKQNNVVAFVMLWMYSWYLQRLKYGRHTNIVVFAMLWKYSWHLQCLNYDEEQHKIIVFAMRGRYSCYLQRIKYNPIVVFVMSWTCSLCLHRLTHNGEHNNNGTPNGIWWFLTMRGFRDIANKHIYRPICIYACVHMFLN